MTATRTELERWLDTNAGNDTVCSIITYNVDDANQTAWNWKSPAEREAEKRRWLDLAHPLPPAPKKGTKR